MLSESDQEPRQGSRRVGVWDEARGVGRVHPNRHFGTFFSWFEDKRMRDLGSQREEGMLCGRNGMNQDSETGMSKSLKVESHQAPPSLGSSRQEHRSGLPCPSPMHESEK